MEDQHSGSSITEATLKRLRDDWKVELNQTIATLRDEIELRLQSASQETNAGWFVRRIEALERENLSLRLERDRAIAQPSRGSGDGQAEEILQLRAENEALERDLRQAHAKLDGFRLLLNGEDESDEPDASVDPSPDARQADSKTQPENGSRPNVLSASQNSVAAEPKQGQPKAGAESASSSSASSTAQPAPAQTNPQQSSSEAARRSASEDTASGSQGKTRGPKAGRAFNRAEAIFLAVKDWNRSNPSETFVINPGMLETVFHVHRQAAKDFFAAYQNELWDYHQEINVESPRWHNRGKDTEKLKAFVDERLGAE